MKLDLKYLLTDHRTGNPTFGRQEPHILPLSFDVSLGISPTLQWRLKAAMEVLLINQPKQPT